MKPKLRKEASLEFHHRIVSAAYNTIENTEEYPFQSCLSCIHFKEITEICNLANQRPPAKIIVYGCPKYEDINEIPF